MSFFSKTPEEKKIKELTGGIVLSSNYRKFLRENEILIEEGRQVQFTLKKEYEKGLLSLEQIENRFNELIAEIIKKSHGFEKMKQTPNVSKNDKNGEKSKKIVEEKLKKAEKKRKEKQIENERIKKAENEKNKKIVEEIHDISNNKHRNIDKIKGKPVIYSKEMMCIQDSDYCGEYVKSQNGKYLLTWLDGDFEKDILGSRESGNGILIFFEDNKYKYQLGLQRPNNGKIAENGTIVIEEWLFSDDLVGNCLSIDKKEKILINHRVNANLLNCAISKEGNYALFQTAMSENHEDGNKIFFFDLNEKKLVWVRDNILFAHEKEKGGVKKYIIDEELNIINMYYNNNYIFKYDFEGNFIDEKKHKDLRLKVADRYDLFNIINENFNDLDNANANIKEYIKLESFVEKCLKSDISDNTKSKLSRRIGEIYLKNKNEKEALIYFEKALKYNPKIGIKRKYEKLKKQLDQK